MWLFEGKRNHRKQLRLKMKVTEFSVCQAYSVNSTLFPKGKKQWK